MSSDYRPDLVRTSAEDQAARRRAERDELRDRFAIAALAAMELQICIAEPAAKHMATSAYVVADAMLKARTE